MFDPIIGRWLEEDPIDFEGADPNLYRYCGNNPTNAIDPEGLQAIPLKVDVGEDDNLKVPTGKLTWSFAFPQAPPGLHVYSLVDLSWEVEPGVEGPVPLRRGAYRYWFVGPPSVSALEFNLSPRHGSHNGPRNAIPAYPIFPGDTPAEKDKALRNYLVNSFNMTNTRGHLKAVIELRGYERKSQTQFTTRNLLEKGGPFEFHGENPLLVDGPDSLYRPNRVRTSFRTRNSAWSEKEPDVWGTAPTWRYRTVLEYTWDTSSVDGFFGLYSVTEGDKKPIRGASFNPTSDMMP